MILTKITQNTLYIILVFSGIKKPCTTVSLAAYMMYLESCTVLPVVLPAVYIFSVRACRDEMSI